MSAASPGSLEELVGVLGVAADWVAVAGGTDLLVRTPEERAALIPTLDLLRVPELQGIADEGDTWRVGATTSFTAIREHTALAKDLPILAQAAGVVGGWQIQNRATLGGNMANASPAGDSLPVLLALEAQLTLVGPDGDREVAYSAFHTGYRQTALARNEVIGWIRIPKPPADSVQRYRKVGTREAQAISKIVVALERTQERERVVGGAPGRGQRGRHPGTAPAGRAGMFPGYADRGTLRPGWAGRRQRGHPDRRCAIHGRLPSPRPGTGGAAHAPRSVAGRLGPPRPRLPLGRR